jgi:hypothetical protein
MFQNYNLISELRTGVLAIPVRPLTRCLRNVPPAYR